MIKAISLLLGITTIIFLMVVFDDLSARESPHGDIPWDCDACHTPEGWSQIRESRAFSHSETGFPLTGAHNDASCRGCHKDLRFANIGVECADCHTDVHRAQFGIECRNCHTPVDWQDREDIMQTHAERGFPLVGVHVIVDCDACHIAQGREEFVNTPVECGGCHIDNFNETVDPDHSLANFSLDCQECHAPVSSAWSQAIFQHPQQFALRGAHTTIRCNACHSETFAGTSQLCFGCHENDYNLVEVPSHVTLGFPTECQSCHNEVAWSGAIFDHVQASGFELVGIHSTLSCVDCHANNQFDLPRECIGCHQNDYSAVTDPSHVNAGFPEDCTQCHNQNGWSPATFDHNLTSFPLTGQHLSIDCSGCHVNGQFTGTPSDCWSCHQDNYNGVGDPDHAANNFSQDCTQCHTTSGWTPSTFNHAQTQFPLTGAHTTLNCVECHADGYSGTPTDCWSCHQEDYIGVEDPDHVANNFSHDCTECHNTDGWDTGVFNHSQTQFPITGAHTLLDCIDCHAGGYSGTPTECLACHEDNYNNTTDPDHQAAGFPTTCEVCHSTNGWTPAVFDHSQTQFPLTGAHLTLNCVDCHADGYSGTPTDCWSCHQDDYNNVTDPDHVENNFGQDCTQCHSTNGWTPATFNHSQTQFPLTGAHLTLNCLDCHADGYSGTPTDCWSCHQEDYLGTNDPDHAANNFSQDCTLCHSTSGWSPSTFNHNQTQFPLTGAHTTLNCVECHADGYSGTPTDCWSCHEEDYLGADDPDHVANNFSHDCTECHTTDGWDTGVFNHNQTQFPITGAHTLLDCIDCHAGGYSGTPTECFACHEDNFNNTTDPDHQVAGFPTTCEVCHSTTGWTPAVFDHSQTQFPLTGAHTSLNCIDCHADGYSGTPTDCWSCHQDDYNNVVDPDHVENNFGQDCTQCHNTNGWTPASFDHSQTQFPLTGAHLVLTCIQCHAQGYSGTPTDCWSCHEDDYTGANDPNHVENNFPQDCTICHSTSSWEPSTFDHNQTQFPLTGEHLTLNCQDCHADGYSGTPTDCWSCHQDDYNNVANPDHVAGNYNHDCTQCHTTNGWTPASFDHNQTQFPLTGAHLVLACIACHASGYNNTPTACFACHEDDYNNTTDPDHQAAGFPTTCEQCHNTSNWEQTTWDHDNLYFPIYSGRHQGRWNICADCHVDPNNYEVFECIFCHEHNQPDTDPEHVGVPGYVYESTACYNCHPDGN